MVFGGKSKGISQRFLYISDQVLCLYELSGHHSTQCKLTPVYMEDSLAVAYSKWFLLLPVPEQRKVFLFVFKCNYALMCILWVNSLKPGMCLYMKGKMLCLS